MSDREFLSGHPTEPMHLIVKRPDVETEGPGYRLLHGVANVQAAVGLARGPVGMIQGALIRNPQKWR